MSSSDFEVLQPKRSGYRFVCLITAFTAFLFDSFNDDARKNDLSHIPEISN